MDAGNGTNSVAQALHRGRALGWRRFAGHRRAIEHLFRSLVRLRVACLQLPSRRTILRALPTAAMAVARSPDPAPLPFYGPGNQRFPGHPQPCVPSDQLSLGQARTQALALRGSCRRQLLRALLHHFNPRGDDAGAGRSI